MTITEERVPTWMQPPAEMPRTFALQLTDQDVADGAACSSEHCPIALALSRWLFDHGYRFVNVSVNHFNAEIVLDWRLPCLRYWHTGHQFISSFDQFRPTEPCIVSFTRDPR